MSPIEDDDRIRRSLTMALADDGYVARGASTAEEGLAAQRRDAADTVLAGLVLSRLGHIPTTPGGVVGPGAHTAEVTQIKGRAITQVRVRKAG
ncbi:CBS domain containing-hemolysin-like protein [Catenuloplanes indicus]|uniref:CBS domain containing-hemolysin-like protein n=2 Tax=Catenuloplanes indicus TaxID=137267 RepID=A0AAE3VX48_9ACTN|nr:CBS domain containing-hemolysin-like protein [Catenuloplanes indicus]